MGSAAGVLFAAWGIDLLIAIGTSSDIPRLQTARIDSTVLLFAVGSFLICGTAVGLIPAWRISSSNLSSTLKEGETRSATTPRQSLRKALVVAEITLALVLLCSAGLLIKTLSKLNAVDPGFDPSRVLVAELVLPNSKYPDDARRSAFFQQLLERVKALPDVEAAGGTSNLPLSGTNMVFMAAVEGRASLPTGFRAVTTDYLRTMRIPLLKGRSFDDRDTATSQSVVLINKTMARQLWSSEEALGKRIRHGFKNQLAEVVGVVDDIKYGGLDKESKPEMYAPFVQRPFPFMRVVVRTKSDPTYLTESIRQEVQSIDKDQPIDKVTTMSAVVSQSIAARRFYMQLLGIFAGIAFILASVGIYGIVSYSVSQRTREIGIRLALGANRRDVLRLVLGEGFRLAVIGVGLGLVGAFGATRVLTSLLFQVRPTDPMTFIGLSLLLALVALVASYIPARRATKVDPLVALREE